MAEERTITLEFKWSVSRGRDTYGYNICTLYADGVRVARCNGGGYDMQGTVLGLYLAGAFRDRLLRLPGAPAELRVPCDRCAGTGKRAYTHRCTHCGGTGYVGPLDITCGACKGIGYVDDDPADCAHCGGSGQVDNEAGAFYGLTFHDPNYDPGKAVIGADVSDRTLATIAGGSSTGKTVEQAERDGDSIGLERYQAIYAASSKWPTARHTIPSIDGACGTSSVEKIGRAIGLEFQGVRTRSKNLSVVLLTVGADPHAG